MNNYERGSFVKLEPIANWSNTNTRNQKIMNEELSVAYNLASMTREA